MNQILIALLISYYCTITVPTDLPLKQSTVEDYQFLQSTVYDVGWGDYEVAVIHEIIMTESRWNPTAYNDEVVHVYGLGQVTKWWIKSPALKPFRLTEDYEKRDLFNSRDNILTMVELLRYYYDMYGDDWHRILSAYSSGQDLGITQYSKLILSKVDSLEYIDYFDKNRYAEGLELYARNTAIKY